MLVVSRAPRSSPSRHWINIKNMRGRRALQGEGDQVRDAVATEYHRGEAACDYGEKKAGCDGVFHGGLKVAPLPREEG
jgi:hypothetical protein